MNRPRPFGAAFALGLLLAAPAALAQTYVPGQTYFGRSNYIEYTAGNLPIIISAPHGGTLNPAELPDRTYGTFSTDTATDVLARDIRATFSNRFGATPHVIICRLDRQKIDCNREVIEGAQSNALTGISWTNFQDFIAAAKQTVSNQFGRGFYIDLHGHGHDLQRLELGYLLTASELGLSDATLNGSSSYANGSSIRELNQRSPVNFATLLRGSNSLGGLLASNGYPSVPSPAIPDPDTNAYFNGGYNTDAHSSVNGGTISGLQIECNYTNVRDSAFNRLLFSTNLAKAVDTYCSNHFPLNLHDKLPVLSSITNRTINEDTSTGPIAFTVTDDITSATNLVLGKMSSDTNLVPLAKIVLAGTGTNRTVTVTPATNAFGSATITVTATDTNGGTGSESFVLTVNPINDAPVLAPVSNFTVNAGVTLLLTNSATDLDGDVLTFSLLTAPSNATINASNGVFSWRPAVALANTTNPVKVTVADDGTPMLRATQAFTVVVNPLAAFAVTQVTPTNNRIRLTITGDPGPDYTVQATSNFASWTNLVVTNPLVLPFNFTDTNAASFLQRFYRVLLGP